MTEKSKQIRYESINGLRMLACFGIVFMHVKANVSYSFGNHWSNIIISEFTNFVFLFMIISAFGMCCGYFKKISQNEISPEKFYSKRILKNLPFFCILLLLDIIVEHNISSIIEAFANGTLLFGFLPKTLNVLGVAWFLGLVFLFYLIFPYFTYLFSNKKRAWVTTIVAILMNISCIYYFDVGRNNMFYSFIYFCIGGLLYLYKDIIKDFFHNKRILAIIFICIAMIIYFIIPSKNEYLLLFRVLLTSVLLLCYAITFDRSIILNNKISKFFGDISLEIYLCHMVVFRIVEKLHLTHLFSNDWLSYILCVLLVLIGATIIAILFKKTWNYFILKGARKHENIISK